MSSPDDKILDAWAILTNALDDDSYDEQLAAVMHIFSAAIARSDLSVPPVREDN